MNRKLTALILSGAMVCALSVQSLAAEPADPAAGESQVTGVEVETALPDSVLYYGTIVEIGRDESGEIRRLVLDSERYGSYVMNISEETVWIDSGNRTAGNPDDLKEGERVYVFHSPIATMSLPPQSPALAVVWNLPQDVGCAQYHEVEQVEQLEDGSVRITTDNGGLILTVSADGKATSYETGEAVELSQLQAGDRIMAWYSVVLESYPAQAGTDTILVLPRLTEEEAETEVAETAVGQTLTIRLNGADTEIQGRYENGVAMVPVAAVGQALGYEVNYTQTENGAEVTVESDTFEVRLVIGQEEIFGVTKIEGAVGMTAPQTYGAAPYIADPGTTWAPAELFTILGRTVTVDGSLLTIE